MVARESILPSMFPDVLLVRWQIVWSPVAITGLRTPWGDWVACYCHRGMAVPRAVFQHTLLQTTLLALVDTRMEGVHFAARPR